MVEQVFSGSPWERKVGYSRAIRRGPHIWVAGTTAMRDGQVVAPGDAYAQASTCLEIITAALAELGGSAADVVRTRMYVTNIADFEAVGRAHADYFLEVCPAATLVEVSALVHPDLVVEIEAEAYVRA